jgi:hypothetical protein
METAETLSIECTSCGKLIVWPKEHQLMVHLGAWSKPTECPVCHSARKPISATPTMPAAPAAPFSSADEV